MELITKDDFRKEALARRDALSVEVREKASSRICQAIMDSPEFLDAGGIHVFVPIKTEVDILPLIRVAWELEKSVGMMRVMRDGGMQQLAITPDSDFHKTDSGIFEPQGAEPFDMNLCELVIVPIVAADEKCNRIGYGRGYYDQMLMHTPRPTIGVAFDVQIFPRIPCDSGDFRLDVIYSEVRQLNAPAFSTN